MNGIGPLVVVAGGCDPHSTIQMEAYRDLLQDGFSEYGGILLSGGTTQGISGLVGQLAEESDGRIVAVGHRPRTLPLDGTATPDDRYEIRYADGEGEFTGLEPVQYWLDLLATVGHEIC